MWVKDEVIKDFVMLNNNLFFATIKNGVAASLYKVEQGGIKKVVLPRDFGSIQMISQGNYRKDFWIKVKGWITPERRYWIDTETLEIMEDNLVPLIQYQFHHARISFCTA